MSKTIFMLQYGDKYSPKDVNRVVVDTEGRYNYVVYTDDPDNANYISTVETVELKENFETFTKAIMLGETDRGQCLYLDLDVIIEKPNLDHLFSEDKPKICKTWWKHEGFEREYGGGDFNSSVLSWNGTNAKEIYDDFIENPDWFMCKWKGKDDRFLFWEHGDRFDVYPKRTIYSWMYGIDYKTDIAPRARKFCEDASICLLNGNLDDKINLRDDYFEMKKSINNA